MPWTKLNYVKNNVFIIFVCLSTTFLSHSLSYFSIWLVRRVYIWIWIRCVRLGVSTNDGVCFLHTCPYINLASKCGQSPNLQTRIAPINMCKWNDHTVWCLRMYICTKEPTIYAQAEREQRSFIHLKYSIEVLDWWTQSECVWASAPAEISNEIHSMKWCRRKHHHARAFINTLTEAHTLIKPTGKNKTNDITITVYCFVSPSMCVSQWSRSPCVRFCYRNALPFFQLNNQQFFMRSICI